MGLFLYLDSMRILNAVIAHKDFYWNDLPEEELSKYLVFTYNDIKTNIPNVVKLERVDNLCDNFYSEMASMKYIRHNVDFDWIYERTKILYEIVIDIIFKNMLQYENYGFNKHF